ncbi:MAG: acyltransferase [Betaproteobacteria bacterium]|nr:acyltransferase [Betaproteobacteria bacterium]
MQTKFDSIQMMRGIAAFSVIGVHIGMIGNGAFGVDLFFCISGFIMMHVTERSAHQFLKKRAIRIIPLYWFTTIVVSVVMFFKPDLFKTSILTLEYFIKSMLFTPYYYHRLNEQPINSILPVGWTLVMEVFFYLLFFISMKINHKNRHYIVTGIFVVMNIIGLTVKSDNTFIRFYCVPTLLEFSLGIFAYKLLTRSNAKKWSRSASIIALFIASFIWVSLFALKYIPQTTGIIELVKYGPATFVFFLLVFKALEEHSVPRPLIILGNISYSLYLTHLFVLQGFNRLVYSTDSYSLIGVVLVIFVIIPTTIFVAWVSWWLIENKFTEWIKNFLSTRVTKSLRMP